MSDSNPNDFAADIPESLARRAHDGTSHSPEDRGRQERASYAEGMAHDFAALTALATTDEKRATLAAEFPRYRAAYARHYTAWLTARTRCVSALVTGGGNFPHRRNAKRNDIADKRMRELIEFRKRALAAISKALQPELAPIMSGDADAVERLRADQATRQVKQDRMKAANAAIRKHAKAGPEAQIAALVALGIGPALARELLKPDDYQRIGYASFEITNNGARIREIEKRIAALEVAKATPAAEVEGTAAILEECPAENRVRLFFPSKPDVAIRERLKRGGFRWAPTVGTGAWQAYLNPTTCALARSVAGVTPENVPC